MLRWLYDDRADKWFVWGMGIALLVVSFGLGGAFVHLLHVIEWLK